MSRRAVGTIFAAKKRNMKNKTMKVSDFEVDFDSGVFNCCQDHVYNCSDPCKENDLICCDECGISMRLEKVNGKLMWRAVK